jgi:ESCRT-II complex subunit VPS36
MVDVLSAHRRLDRMGGLITLTDLYCLLNRARGSELVSPDDLLQSAHLLARLDVGMYLRRFPSGALCVQSQGFDEDGMCTKVLTMTRASAGSRVHAAGVASAFHTSLVVATNHLLVATARGHMCVDESRWGTFYYANTFSEYMSTLQVAA